MCHRIATRVIGASLKGLGPLMFRILDRYIVREVLLPFCLSLLVLTFLLEIPTIMAQGEQLIAKGVDWITVVPILATCCRGARHHDPDGAAAGDPDRARPPVGRPRVCGAPGLRRQHLPDAATRWRCSRPLATAATAYVMIVAAAGPESEIPRDHLQRPDVERRRRYQAARLLPGLRRQPRRCTSATSAGPADGATSSSTDSSGDETTAYFAEERSVGDRSGPADGRARAREGRAPHDLPEQTGRLQRGPVLATGPVDRLADGVSSVRLCSRATTR